MPTLHGNDGPNMSSDKWSLKYTPLEKTVSFFGEEMLDNPPAPTLFTRFNPMSLYLASTSKNSRGSEISL